MKEDQVKQILLRLLRSGVINISETSKLMFRRGNIDELEAILEKAMQFTYKRAASGAGNTTFLSEDELLLLLEHINEPKEDTSGWRIVPNTIPVPTPDPIPTTSPAVPFTPYPTTTPTVPFSPYPGVYCGSNTLYCGTNTLGIATLYTQKPS